MAASHGSFPTRHTHRHRASLGCQPHRTATQSPGPWSGPLPTLEGPQCSALWHPSTPKCSQHTWLGKNNFF